MSSKLICGNGTPVASTTINWTAQQGKSLFQELHLIKDNEDVALVLSGEINKTSLEPFGALFFLATILMTMMKAISVGALA
ncbi:hypothetical protein SBP18_11065 [Rhodoferax ferrireducens]|uniref:hypothetical protein n=1 Tax=Rhodoferax ferrireducens TaxID=192843 RepID=UPI00298E5636|nr:hypothetical protein [Rhodoferax ferrireducens]WPC65053.1 hypothetical protein SBP18_11065 [Rhodoferax ferrireducens]